MDKVLKMRVWLVIAASLSLIGFSLHAQDGAPAASTVAPGYREARLFVSGQTSGGFSNMPPTVTRLTFTNSLPALRSLTNQVLMNGSGVAAGDVDGDGFCDLFFCNLSGQNKLFRNLGGFRFADISARAGLGVPILNSSGAALVDFDGDGDLDLFLTTIGNGTYLFLNDGTGSFTEKSSSYNLKSPKSRTSMAFADVDGDGWLDLYVAAYRSSMLMDMPNTRFSLKTVGGTQLIERVNGRSSTSQDLTNRFRISPGGNVEELGEVDDLLLNQQGQSFQAVPFTSSKFRDSAGVPLVLPPFDWGLSVMMRDFNGDGSPDIYVCNDFDSPDRFWLNDGAGNFKQIGWEKFRKTSLFSMGLDVADINRDGREDFFVLDMLSPSHLAGMTHVPDRKPYEPLPGQADAQPGYMRNTLYLQQDDGAFFEIAAYAGVEASDWSWCPVFLDVDLDGYEDLLITNGHAREARNADIAKELREIRTSKNLDSAGILASRSIIPPLPLKNMAFRNRGNLTFSSHGAEWNFDHLGISHGMALADLDNDGDQDVVINNLNEAASILRNQSAKPRISIRLKGNAPNTRGIGAKIFLKGGGMVQSQEMIAGGRYLSSDEPLRTFAALTNSMQIEVRWRSGKVSKVPAAQANFHYEIIEEFAAEPADEVSETNIPIFQDATESLGHQHAENYFDDYTFQPLLPYKTSQPGPGISCLDYNSDGWDDLAIGGAKGNQMALFLNNKRGGFARQISPELSQPLSRDQTALLGVPTPGGVILLANHSNIEDASPAGVGTRAYSLDGIKRVESIPTGKAALRSLAVADLLHDGTLIMVRAGQTQPRQSPTAAGLEFFRMENGKFHPQAEWNRQFQRVGVVQSAIFSDVNNDGWQDLLVAMHWGPIRLFLNQQGKFTEHTQQMGLHNFHGLWNSVATADFNGDGLLDMVACNWGRNSSYQRLLHVELRLYFVEPTVQGESLAGLLEAYFDPDQKKYVPVKRMDVVSRGFPGLTEKFKSHRTYGMAGVIDLLPPKAKHLTVNHLDSVVFMNHGTNFVMKSLPAEAQFTVSMGAALADFNGDGHKDIFLSQNFFALPPDHSRQDAGRGLLMQGDGQGGFKVLSSRESGLDVPGEQRGTAYGDFNNDGRIDLVVAQNSGATRLYLNKQSQVGLRVYLKYGVQNSVEAKRENMVSGFDGQAIGAGLRLVKNGKQHGPLHEIQFGSGYLSQNSAVAVIHQVKPGDQIAIRWPDGREEVQKIPAQALEIELAPGKAPRKLK